MKLEKRKLSSKFGKNIIFRENLSKYSWFNLGGPAEIFFKPDSIEQLKDFLRTVKDFHKIICLGAGSNTLIREGGFNGAVIKLSPKFSYINRLEKNILEVGAGTLDKTLSRFAADNSIANFEFLSCIPGSIGGAIIMNSGCYGDEISNILISIKTIDFDCNLKEFKRDQIKFNYRGTNLPKDLIILSAKLQAKRGDKSMINKKIKNYIEIKKNSQPNQVKTCGSTFKNPKNKKAWELIKDSNCKHLSFGKASISKKHCNFFVNEGGASSKDIERLIELVRQKVFEKYNIKLELEIKIVGETNNND
tara:strand:- start:18 stop:932 length:915 start_codon:yes stop_codon:yes gene_type:complete